MKLKNLPKMGGGISSPSYVAPDILLHEFAVERGFADTLTTADAWTKGEEEEL